MAKKKVVKKAAKKVLSLKIKVSCERELRRYVKRTGGFRKGISDVDKTRAVYLMKLLGRKEIVWDKSIIPIQ